MARNNDLLRQLIASPHPLPAAQPRALTVAPAASLGAHAAFGPASPPALGRGSFSGAVAGRQPMNVIHPQMPQSFQAPAYSALGAQGVHPIVAALAPILSAFGATGALGAGGGGGTGLGVGAGPPLPPPSIQSPTLIGRSAPVTSSTPSSPVGAPVGGGGYVTPTPNVQSAILGALLANPAIGKRGVYQV